MAIDSAEARKLSKGAKDKWLLALSSGEMSIDDALTYSRTQEPDSNYVASVRLVSILEQLPGWSDAAAIGVITKNGFKQNDTLKTIRSSPTKTARFKYIFDNPPPPFASTRPEMPKGWPWQGKLADLVRVTGKNIPALEFEGFGEEESNSNLPKRKVPAFAVPDQRADPQTGEILDPQPFWESKKPDVPAQPDEPSVDENDIAQLFGEERHGIVDESDIEELLK